METQVRHAITERALGAALLNPEIYEEVEEDASATAQAAILVGAVALCAAAGGARGGTSGILAALVAAYVGWLLWSGITYLIGDKLLHGTATWGELLRTIGFAQTPGVLYVLGVIPVLGGLVKLIVAFWILVAVVIAIRQALDFSTGRAIATALLGWISYVILAIIAGLIAGITPQLI